MPTQVRLATWRHPASESAPRRGCDAPSRFHEAPVPHEPHHLIRNPRHWLGIGVSRAEIPSRGEFEPFSASRSASIRYPRRGSSTNCHGRMRKRISNQARLSRQESTHEIGNQLVAGPVAAADGISGAGTGERDAVTGRALQAEKRTLEKQW